MSKIAVTCPKCEGNGYIEGFGHVANGVCFRCAGNKTILVSAARLAAMKAVKPLTPYQAEQVARIETADLSVLSYRQLLALRDFAHWPLPAAPRLLQTWRERGESHFQARQAERLAAYEAERLVAYGY